MSYLFAAAFSLTALLCIIRFQSRLRILDKPNARSSHTQPRPRAGGLAFIISLLLTLIFFYPQTVDYTGLAAIALVFLLGLFDDIRGLSANKKIIIITSAAALIYQNGYRIDSLGQYLNWDFPLGWFSLPFTLLAIGGLTNAINLIDGLDGLAAGITEVILLAFAYIGYKFQDDTIFVIATTLMVALLPFLALNINPAKIFMGDSGSLSLGFIIAILTVLSLKYIHPVAILYLCAVPIIDTLVVMIRRIVMKKNPFRADKNHIHHILLAFFKSVKTTSLFITLLQVLFCYIGYVVARQIELYPSGLLPLATLISFVILIILNYMIFTTILKNQEKSAV